MIDEPQHLNSASLEVGHAFLQWALTMSVTGES